jgi:ankyrin repeat protein
MDPERQAVKLYKAIIQNDTESIKHIVRRRAMSPNHLLVDESGNPVLPIILACQRAHIESVRQLIILGADVNSQIRAPGLNDYPSSLIAVCAAEDLDPERVRATVQLLLDYGADPSRRCVILTKKEQEEFEKYQDLLRKKDREGFSPALFVHQQEWLRQRSALDFAKKNKYTAAADLLSKALLEQRRKGLKPDEECM